MTDERGGRPDTEQFVTLEAYSSPLEADMVAQILENAGIPAFIEDPSASLRALTGWSPRKAARRGPCVVVAAEDEDAAREVLAGIRAGDEDDTETEAAEPSGETDAPEYVCPKCRSGRIARGGPPWMQTLFLIVALLAVPVVFKERIVGVGVYAVLAILYMIFGGRLVCQRCGAHWRE